MPSRGFKSKDLLEFQLIQKEYEFWENNIPYCLKKLFKIFNFKPKIEYNNSHENIYMKICIKCLLSFGLKISEKNKYTTTKKL